MKNNQLTALEAWHKKLLKFWEKEEQEDKAFVLSHLEVSSALVDLFDRYSSKTNKFKFSEFVYWIKRILETNQSK